jgi:hypothetical protein
MLLLTGSAAIQVLSNATPDSIVVAPVNVSPPSDERRTLPAMATSLVVAKNSNTLPSPSMATEGSIREKMGCSVPGAVVIAVCHVTPPSRLRPCAVVGPLPSRSQSIHVATTCWGLFGSTASITSPWGRPVASWLRRRSWAAAVANARNRPTQAT